MSNEPELFVSVPVGPTENTTALAELLASIRLPANPVVAEICNAGLVPVARDATDMKPLPMVACCAFAMLATAAPNMAFPKSVSCIAAEC